MAVGGAAIVSFVFTYDRFAPTWVAPQFAFASIVLATALCCVAAVAVIVVAWRRQLGEMVILGAALGGASLLPLMHGLMIPGVLYGPNNAVLSTALLAVPLALVIGAPVMFPRHRLAIALARQWRSWSTGWIVITTVLAATFLVWPNALPAPTVGSLAVGVVALAAFAGALSLSLRQLRMYRIGHRPASLATALGFGYLAVSNIGWLGVEPFSLGWWFVHLADALGVLGATVGLVIAHHGDHDLVATLQPVVNHDPLIALELGLTPVVHRFVAALADKDPVTRDHVVRVAELAMRAGVRAGLPDDRLRALGLGALLHDIGKLNVPDAILMKPGSLDDDEFELMKRHTEWGETAMKTSPLLAPAAPLVRWHHERIDGRGYPDGLVDAEIPGEAKLISVCDAWDAMTSDRPYRAGMPTEQALVVLHEHAGTQWCATAVDIVAAEIRETGPVATSAFDRVGETATAAEWADHDLSDCVCADSLPRQLAHNKTPRPLTPTR